MNIDSSERQANVLVTCLGFAFPGVPLPYGRTGEECEAVPETAAAEHPDYHAAHVAFGRRRVSPRMYLYPCKR